MLSGHEFPVVHAEVVDSAARSRPVGQWDRQGTFGEFFPLVGVAVASGVDRTALYGAADSIWVTVTRISPVWRLRVGERSVGTPRSQVRAVMLLDVLRCMARNRDRAS